MPTVTEPLSSQSKSRSLTDDTVNYFVIHSINKIVFTTEVYRWTSKCLKVYTVDTVEDVTYVNI